MCHGFSCEIPGVQTHLVEMPGGHRVGDPSGETKPTMQNLDVSRVS